MALIKCPGCGKRISDKAIKCPGCGKKLRKNKRNKTTMIIIIITSVIAVIVGAILGGIKYREYKEKLVQEEIKRQKQIEETYYTNLLYAIAEMLEGASESENAGNLIKKVWYNTIYEKDDSETNNYTKNSYGTFNYDFNDSLERLYSDSEFQSTIYSIEENQDRVKTVMKELKNPPQEYEEAYETIKGFYDAYLEFTNLILNPNGSYQTFTNNFNEMDSEVVKYYNSMEIYIEE